MNKFFLIFFIIMGTNIVYAEERAETTLLISEEAAQIEELRTTIPECNDFIDTLLAISDRMAELDGLNITVLESLKPQVWNDFAIKIVNQVSNNEIDATLCRAKDEEHKRFLAEILK